MVLRQSAGLGVHPRFRGLHHKNTKATKERTEMPMGEARTPWYLDSANFRFRLWLCVLCVFVVPLIGDRPLPLEHRDTG